MLSELIMPSELGLRTSIQYFKVTFFQTSIHTAPGSTNSPYENPEE